MIILALFWGTLTVFRKKSPDLSVGWIAGKVCDTIQITRKWGRKPSQKHETIHLVIRGYYLRNAGSAYRLSVRLVIFPR
jgi:hypothetical protein